MQIFTGFHAVEERVRAVTGDSKKAGSLKIFYANPGPRVKKILEQAKTNGIVCTACDKSSLDKMVATLPKGAQDHRGIVIQVEGEAARANNLVDFDVWLSEFIARSQNGSTGRNTVVVLDSVTDPHNVGAILRSADQFGASLVVMPERHSANNVGDNDVIARSSAGASSWVPFTVVTNLVRTVKALKDAGFWIYGADAGGESVERMSFPENSVLVMGSEGTGISRLLEEECDSIVSIPTCGKIDSLNVSVAAGVLMYEVYRQSLVK